MEQDLELIRLYLNELRFRNPSAFFHTTLRLEGENKDDVLKLKATLEEIERKLDLLLGEKFGADAAIAVMSKQTEALYNLQCENAKSTTNTAETLIIEKLIFDCVGLNQQVEDINKKIDALSGTNGNDGDNEEEEEVKILDCKDFPFNPVAFSPRPQRFPIVGYTDVGKPSNGSDKDMLDSVQATKDFYIVSQSYEIERDYQEIQVFPMSSTPNTTFTCGDIRYEKYDQTTSVNVYPQGYVSHKTDFYSHDSTSSQLTQGNVDFVYLRLPHVGKFAFQNYQIFEDHTYNSFSSVPSTKPFSTHSVSSYNPSGQNNVVQIDSNFGSSFKVFFPGVNFPGVFLVQAAYNMNLNNISGLIAHVMHQEFTQEGMFAYVRIIDTFKSNNKMGVFRRSPFYLYYLGDCKSIAQPFNNQANVKVSLYSSFGKDKFICTNYDRNNGIKFSKSGDTEIITFEDLNNRKYGYTLMQAHPDPNDNNLIPMIQMVFNSPNRVMYKIFDARLGRQIKHDIPISLVSFQFD